MITMYILAGLIAGSGITFGYSALRAKQLKAKGENTLEESEKKSEKIIEKAEQKSEQIISQAKKDADKIIAETRKENSERRKEIKSLEDSNLERQQFLDKKSDQFDKKLENLRSQNEEVLKIKQDILEIHKKQEEKLTKVAKLSKNEAREKLLKMTERDIKDDIIGLITKLQSDAMEEAEDKAQMILLTAMERMSGDVTAERTVVALKLPDDEMKGKIIGKEGRNIQALQRETGVDVMVDETPGMVTLSSFDPIRRQIARLALELLMKDGRIHPARIEETVKKAEKEINKEINKAGEAAAREVGLLGLPKEMLRMMGELKYRTSYGQNVLKHSIEMTHMAGQIAEEIGADVRTAKIATFFHDMGKAVTHKMEGQHHHIGADFALKYGLSEEIAHAIRAHHDDVEPTTPEALIVRVVDTVSAARPGARNISSENFIERMKELENVATSFDGIDKAYAISAGREVRVIVKPEKIDDLSAIKLARDIATKIESTMQYPGVVKVNVIRETRAEEYAK